ncbi:transcription termination factor 5, mitochondrial [Nylanderia fulva]|uniref:transcription termination factor 5, mitochondrial n=1 Tax=Nylanderia fulva TaxID=613905 RepID=UPI0010FB5E46|nr:transcription termination factor 5, mitochondrial [Nylanderia fulva]
MRFGKRGSSRTSMSYFWKRKEFQKILTTNLGLNSADVEEFIDMNKTILNFPRHRLINNCLICQKYDVKASPLLNFGYCLILRNYKLEHRINMLKDIGVPDLNSSLVGKMVYLFRKHIPMFKEKVNIPVEQNIAKNIFDRLGREVPSDISKLESSSNSLTVNQYYQACLLHCKTRVFDLPYLDDKILLHKYMKFKSISMIAETLKILRINLDYNEDLIKKNPFVITAPADNIKLLLNTFTDICGIPIVTLLRKYPRILFEDSDNIKRLLMSFKRYDIPDEYVQKYMKIFQIGDDTFLEQMETIKRHPDLHVWCKHPRVLRIIFHKDKAKDRVGYLNIINRSKWVRPHTVLSTSNDLERFLHTGASTVLSKKALKHIFMQELGVDKKDLLARHPHWKTVGFADIEQMFKYLKTHFTINEICQNIHVILYSQCKVEKVLADLRRRYSQSTEYSFTNSQYLALCLYILEKDTHFTGDGIWNNEHKEKQQSLLSSEKEHVAENANDNTVKSINDSLNIEVNHNIDDDDILSTKDSSDMDDHDDLNDENETSNCKTNRQHT